MLIVLGPFGCGAIGSPSHGWASISRSKQYALNLATTCVEKRSTFIPALTKGTIGE